MSVALAPIEAETPTPGNGTRHLFVSIGGSYASGQGAPDGKINSTDSLRAPQTMLGMSLPPEWIEARCSKS